MTWTTLNPTALTLSFDRNSSSARSGWTASGDLGSALAGAWAWAPVDAGAHHSQTALPAPAGSRLRAPASILQRMADAARALGRDESDVWVEAAREWLARHDPSTSGGGTPWREASLYAHSSVTARRSRLWSDIDGVLGVLRAEDTISETVSA